MKHIYNQPQFGMEQMFNYSQLYSSVVKHFPSGSKFIETGCWKGRSSAYMAVEIINSKKNIDFYCVDNWKFKIQLTHNYIAAEFWNNLSYKDLDEVYDLYDVFIFNMKPLEKYYIPLKMDSIEASNKFNDNYFDFIFLDASHDKNQIKSEILSWLPKLKVGGILAGHDYYPNRMIEMEDHYGNIVECDIYAGVEETLQNFLYLESQDCFVYRKKR